MGFLTIRTVFERATVLALLNEKEFEGNIALSAAADVKPFNDHYFAVFVIQTEPDGSGNLILNAASSTVVGIQRYTVTRLRYQGIYVMSNPGPNGLLCELLRAHYRAEQEDTLERFSTISALPMPWTKKWYSNSAGDLQNALQFSIADPDIEELNKLFSLGDSRPDRSGDIDDDGNQE